MKTIIVFSPHNDDLEIGLGGTVLKHIEDGYRIVKLVFSAGQLSNPHLKEEIIIKRREREALAVARDFGIHETVFYRLNDQKVEEELNIIEDKVRELLSNERPEKIYLPAGNDAHPDHRAIHHFGMKLLEENDIEIYTYEVWSLTNQPHPSVYIDITPYFSKKLSMMAYFTTEKISVFLQKIPVIYRAIKYGRKIHVRYAEKFYKLR